MDIWKDRKTDREIVTGGVSLLFRTEKEREREIIFFITLKNKVCHL
jgi:hypothetical protein